MEVQLQSIIDLSNTENIWSAEEMQQNLEKINKIAKGLMENITYSE